MKSNVTIANHPLHPILVLLPAGAWLTSIVLDIVFMATKTSFWFTASMWVMTIGIVGALVAATDGFYDLFTLPMTNEPKSIGLEHMALNLLITVLYVINVAAVRSPLLLSATRSAMIPAGTAAWGFILNLVAVILLGISGWLGGEMVYRYGIAIPKETIQAAHQYEAVGDRRRAEAGALGGERRTKEDDDKD
jgi:uncharacterized membrane protein